MTVVVGIASFFLLCLLAARSSLIDFRRTKRELGRFGLHGAAQQSGIVFTQRKGKLGPHLTISTRKSGGQKTAANPPCAPKMSACRLTLMFVWPLGLLFAWLNLDLRDALLVSGLFLLTILLMPYAAYAASVRRQRITLFHDLPAFLRLIVQALDADLHFIDAVREAVKLLQRDSRGGPLTLRAEKFLALVEAESDAEVFSNWLQGSLSRQLTARAAWTFSDCLSNPLQAKTRLVALLEELEQARKAELHRRVGAIPYEALAFALFAVVVYVGCLFNTALSADEGDLLCKKAQPSYNDAVNGG